MSETPASRAFTPEEVRKKLLTKIAGLATYWARVGTDKLDATNGLAFSILNLFDGSNLELPAFDLSPSPSPEDKDYCIQEGENWFEPGVINDCQLHELWHLFQRKS